MKKILFLIVAVLPFIFISCKVEIPIKEMSSAKKGIKRAYEVKADKYDNENLKKAEAFLLLSHDFVKKEDVKKAKEEAVNSAKASELAINNSLPKLSAEYLNEAVKAKNELENLNPEIYAAEEYKSALEFLKKAEDLNSSKQYWESYQLSVKVKPEFDRIKTVCLAGLPALKEKHKNLSLMKTELESGKWAEEGKEELALAEKSLVSAASDLSAENIKSASQNLNEAENKLKSAKLKILKVSAKESILLLREEHKVLTQNRGNEFAEQELSDAAGFLNDAEGLIASDNSDQALQKIIETEKNIKTARDKISRGLALERIKSVETLFETVKMKDNDKKYNSDFDDAESILNESKNSFNEGAIEISMAKADDAEALLYSIAIALEKDANAFAEKESDKSDEQIYIVKYRKKNTDCLWRIALIVYKDARLWPLIYKANKHQIKDPDLIFPGQRFIIPVYPEKVKETSDKTSSETGGKCHTDENKPEPEEKKNESSDQPENKNVPDAEKDSAATK